MAQNINNDLVPVTPVKSPTSKLDTLPAAGLQEALSEPGDFYDSAYSANDVSVNVLASPKLGKGTPPA
jgi:hypothetical protein